MGLTREDLDGILFIMLAYPSQLSVILLVIPVLCASFLVWKYDFIQRVKKRRDLNQLFAYFRWKRKELLYKVNERVTIFLRAFEYPENMDLYQLLRYYKMAPEIREILTRNGYSNISSIQGMSSHGQRNLLSQLQLDGHKSQLCIFIGTVKREGGRRTDCVPTKSVIDAGQDTVQILKEAPFPRIPEEDIELVEMCAKETQTAYERSNAFVLWGAAVCAFSCVVTLCGLLTGSPTATNVGQIGRVIGHATDRGAIYYSYHVDKKNIKRVQKVVTRLKNQCEESVKQLQYMRNVWTILLTFESLPPYMSLVPKSFEEDFKKLLRNVKQELEAGKEDDICRNAVVKALELFDNNLKEILGVDEVFRDFTFDASRLPLRIALQHLQPTDSVSNRVVLVLDALQAMILSGLTIHRRLLNIENKIRSRGTIHIEKVRNAMKSVNEMHDDFLNSC